MAPAKGSKQIQPTEPGPLQLTAFFQDQKQRGVVKAACPSSKDLYAQSTYNSWWIQKKGSAQARKTFNRWYTICINGVYGPDEGEFYYYFLILLFWHSIADTSSSFVFYYVFSKMHQNHYPQDPLF